MDTCSHARKRAMLRIVPQHLAFISLFVLLRLNHSPIKPMLYMTLYAFLCLTTTCRSGDGRILINQKIKSMVQCCIKYRLFGVYPSF